MDGTHQKVYLSNQFWLFSEKNSSKKGAAQVSSKSKAFPQTIDGIEKELEALKGTSSNIS